jgi:hypothetical protein
MIHNYARTLVLAVAIVAASIAVGHAAGDGEPRSIVYRGYLEDANGPVTTEVPLQFKLYSSATSTTALWTSSTKRVTPVGGHFSVVLGDAADELLPNKLGTAVWDSTTWTRLFLEVIVNGSPLAGKQEIFPSALAVNGTPGRIFRASSANIAGALTAGSISTSGSVTAAGLSCSGNATVTGTLTAGTSSVTGNFTVNGSTTLRTTTVNGTFSTNSFYSSARVVATSTNRTATSGLGVRSFCALAYFAFYGRTTDTTTARWHDERYCDLTGSPGSTWTLTARLGNNLLGETQCRAVCF